MGLAIPHLVEASAVPLLTRHVGGIEPPKPEQVRPPPGRFVPCDGTPWVMVGAGPQILQRRRHIYVRAGSRRRDRKSDRGRTKGGDSGGETQIRPTGLAWGG